MTGQEYVRVQEKYIKAHDVKLHAKLWTSTNDIPDIPDESIGRFRREIAIMFPYTFKPNPDPDNPMEKLEDPDLEDKLTTDEELSGIFNMLTDELHDILYKQKRRVHIDIQDIEARKKHREMLKHPLKFFVDEVIDVYYSTSDDSIRKDDLYKIYLRFCELNDLNPTDKESFGRQLKKTEDLKDRLIDGGRESTKDRTTGKRMTIWKGIKVKPQWLDEEHRARQTNLWDKPEEEEEEHSSNTSTDNTTSEKKASEMSEMSGIFGQNNISVQKNDVDSDHNSRSNIASDTDSSPVLELKNAENATRSLTIPDIYDADSSSKMIDIAYKATIDYQGNNKGYFTLDDLEFNLQMLPNEQWTSEQVEQTLYQLLEEGKIQEIELGTGKFEPTENLNPNGGGD